MESEEYSENELQQALALDLVTTFPQLVGSYHTQLYRYVVGQVKNQQDAEDIMQNSWVRIYQALDQYSEERLRSLQLRAWLFTIVRNQMLTQLRKKTVSSAIPIEDLGDSLQDNWTPQPEDLVELRSQVEEVRAIIEQLSPTLRVVLTLYLFQGLEYQEIAEQLGQPVGNVRTYVSRGMSLLRERLTTTVN